MILLTYVFPPLSSGGTAVVMNLARYMPLAGWEVLPLTVSGQKGFSVDDTLESALPDGLRVTRIPHCEPFYRSKPGRSSPLGPERSGQGILRRMMSRFIHSYVLVPDRVITWRRSVVRAGVRLVREENASVIVSFGPHHSLHLHAAKIAAATGILYVPFFGDLWLADSNVEWPSRLNRMIEAGMERRVVVRAAGIAATTVGSTKYFSRTYGNRCPPLHVVENGYDPDRIHPATEDKTRSENLIISFTGNFFGLHSPEPLLRGLKLFFDKHPEAPLLMRFIGCFEGDYANLPRRMGLAEKVEMPGSVDYSAVPGYQLDSDVLLAYLSPLPGAEMKNSSKLAEYLRTGRSILAIAPEGDMTEYVRRFDAGYVCHPSPEQISDTLERVLSDWENGVLVRVRDQNGVADVFDARNIAERFGHFLDQISEKRPGS
jgi:glycosyltransferase involved in cell wall biosynthesis